MKLRYRFYFAVFFLLLSSEPSLASPTQYGDTGLLSQPSAETLDSGTFSFGLWGNRSSGLTGQDATLMPVTLAFGLNPFLEIYGSYPNLFFNDQDQYSGRGYTNLGIKYRFWGERSAPFKMALDGQIRRSVAEENDLDGLVDLQGRFITSYQRDALGWHVNAGYLFKDSPDEINYDDQLVLGGGFEFFPTHRLRLIAEIEGQSSKLSQEEEPIEATLGFNYFLTPDVQFNLGLAGGLTDASPDWRALVGISAVHAFNHLTAPIHRTKALFGDERHPTKPTHSEPAVLPSVPDPPISTLPLEIAVTAAEREVVVGVDEKFSPETYVSQESLALAPIAQTGSTVAEAAPQPINTLVYRKFRLPDFSYEVGQNVLSEDGMRLLSQIADELRRDSDWLILRIDGHTDNIGPDRYNDELSLKRAIAAANHLMLRDGLSPERLFVKGFGERIPIASNDTPAGRSQNRRLELLVLKPKASVQ